MILFKTKKSMTGYIFQFLAIFTIVTSLLFGGASKASAEPLDDQIQQLQDLIEQLQAQIGLEEEINNLIDLISDLQDQISGEDENAACYIFNLPEKYHSPTFGWSYKFNQHSSLVAGDALANPPTESYPFSLSFSNTGASGCDAEYERFVVSVAGLSENLPNIQVWTSDGDGGFIDSYDNPNNVLEIVFMPGLSNYPTLDTYIASDAVGEYGVMFLLSGVDAEDNSTMLGLGYAPIHVLAPELDEPYYFDIRKALGNFTTSSLVRTDGVKDGTEHSSNTRQITRGELLSFDTLRDRNLLPSSENYYSKFEYRLKVLRGDRSALQIWSDDFGPMGTFYNIAGGEDSNWGRTEGVGRSLFGENYVYYGNEVGSKTLAYAIASKSGTYEIQFELYGYRDGVITSAPIATTESVSFTVSSPARRSGGSFAPGYGPNARPATSAADPSTETPVVLESVLETESSSIGILGWMTRLFGFFIGR